MRCAMSLERLTRDHARPACPGPAHVAVARRGALVGAAAGHRALLPHNHPAYAAARPPRSHQLGVLDVVAPTLRSLADSGPSASDRFTLPGAPGRSPQRARRPTGSHPASATTSVGASTLRADGPDVSPLGPSSWCAGATLRLRWPPAVDADDAASPSVPIRNTVGAARAAGQVGPRSTAAVALPARSQHSHLVLWRRMRVAHAVRDGRSLALPALPG